MKIALKFLVSGTNEEILAVLKRLIEKNGWLATLSRTSEESLKLMQEQEFDILLLSSGLSEKTEASLRAAAEGRSNPIKVIEHYGGGSGLLKNEVYEIFPELQNDEDSLS